MTERIQDIAHLGRIELLTPEIERSRWFFETLLGMEVAHAAGTSLYLRGYGDYAASTLKLTESDKPGIGAISWRTSGPEALRRRVAAIQAAGLGERWREPEFGRGPAFRFRDPDGHAMDVYYEEQKYVAPAELRSSLKNLPMKYTARGVNVRRLDHLALMARDVGANREFAQESLGFALREQVLFDHGK